MNNEKKNKYAQGVRSFVFLRSILGKLNLNKVKQGEQQNPISIEDANINVITFQKGLHKWGTYTN